MKLYEVTKEGYCYVLAGNEQQAQELVDIHDFDIFAVETSSVFGDWMDKEPINGDGRTCNQIIKDKKQVEADEPKNLPSLFDE